MNNQLSNYNSRAQELERLITGLQNMDDAAADNMGTANQDLVAYQNELAEIRRRQEELQHKIINQERNTFVGYYLTT